MNDTPALSAETADRKHVPQLERQAENQRPKTHDHREAKLYRYAGTDLYQWFSKRGVSVFEEQASEPFVLRARSDHQPTGEVEELARRLEQNCYTFPELAKAAQALRSLSGQVAEKDALWAKDMSAVIDQRNAAGAERDEARATIEHQAQELERLRGALRPSGDTKAAYSGEFFMGVTLRAGHEEEYRRLPIPWTTIKEIMAAIKARSALNEVKSNG